MVKTQPIKDRNLIQQIKNYYINRNNYRDLLLFTLGINCGLKLSDLLKLNVKDVTDKPVLELKFGIEILITEDTKEIIQKVVNGRKKSSPLFLSFLNKRLTRYGAFTSFKNVCKDLKINYSINSWRKTFGYHYYIKHHDLLFLQWYFKQNTLQQTVNYIGIEESIGARFKGSPEL